MKVLGDYRAPAIRTKFYLRHARSLAQEHFPAKRESPSGGGKKLNGDGELAVLFPAGYRPWCQKKNPTTPAPANPTKTIRFKVLIFRWRRSGGSLGNKILPMYRIITVLRVVVLITDQGGHGNPAEINPADRDVDGGKWEKRKPRGDKAVLAGKELNSETTKHAPRGNDRKVSSSWVDNER